MKKYIKTIGVFAIALTVVACQKDDLSSSELEAYDEVVNSEMEQQDVQHDEIVGTHEDCEGQGFKHNLPDCARVTESGESFPKTITIDFGSGCETKNGRTKLGKVIITQTDEMLVVGASRTITFENFSVNEVSLEGERVVVNQGDNSAGNLVFSIDGDITATKGKRSRNRVFSRQREWTVGRETCDRADDEFMITGNATITAGKHTITREITEAIHITPGVCKYPRSGKLFIDMGRREGTIDFGDGTCDNVATLTTSKGKVKEIDLDNRKCRR
ncbi:MAG: hypothetical protein ACJAZ2_002260 [Glaciecola sp.]|jgi:hypothetical protein